MMKNARKIATWFSYTQGNRYTDMWSFGDAAGGVPHNKLKLDLNGTRIEAAQRLLESELRMNRALRPYAQARRPNFDASDEAFERMQEAEAVGEITKITTVHAQSESKFTGAYPALVKGTTMNGLRATSIHLVDLERAGPNARLPRNEVPMSSLSSFRSARRCAIARYWRASVATAGARWRTWTTASQEEG